MSFGYSVAIPTVVAPGEMVDVSIQMRAPLTPGAYRSSFMLRNEAGVIFGLEQSKLDSFWLEINVFESIVTFDFVENICAADWASGSGILPCPGAAGDPRGYVQRIPNPTLENGVTDENPGMLAVPDQENNGQILGFFPLYRVQVGDHFQSIVNCEAGATDCLVVFQLDYYSEAGPIQSFWAIVEQYEGTPTQVDIDLSSLAGQEVSFILSVRAVGPAVGDRALWGAPRIVRKFDNSNAIPDSYFYQVILDPSFLNHP